MVNTPQINPYCQFQKSYCSAPPNQPAYQAPVQQVYPQYNYNTYTTQQPGAVILSQDIVNKNQARNLKNLGNEKRLQGNYQEAINHYKKALELDPVYTDVLYNLGRTYSDMGQPTEAIKTFQRLLEISPQDYESRTLLGEFYEEINSLDAAMAEYEKVLQQAPNYDYARRNLSNVYVKKVALSDPDQANQIIQQTAKENLQKALKLVQEQAPPYIVQNLQGLTIAFGPTEAINKYENLAQYEHSNKRILTSNKLIFASPNVIATYLVHEAVHAGDKDAITSIREEQDAFREMTKFWIATNNGVIDPDLTLAMRLYTQAPEKLDQKVEDLYTKRDPRIRRTSPGHGESYSSGTFMENIYNGIRSFLPVNGLYNSAGWVPSAPAVPQNHYYQPIPVSSNPFNNVNAPQFVFSHPLNSNYAHYRQYPQAATQNPFAYNEPIEPMADPISGPIRLMSAELGMADKVR
jgi:tetratricopeptide (TPR) repeat protein